MTTERDKLAARIRALRAKTVKNGCTDDEAIAAAEMLAKLLDKYNMTVDEAELRESQFTRHTQPEPDLVGDRLWKVAKAIAELTEVRYWVSPAGVSPVEVSFFGFDHEVEGARYLLDICSGAMRREHRRLQKAYALLVRDRQRLKILPFLDGMADSLARRIRALKAPRPTGKGLVVLKDQLIAQAMDDAGLKTRHREMRGSRNNEDTYGAGVKAGEQVALNRGLRGGCTDQQRRLT